MVGGELIKRYGQARDEEQIQIRNKIGRIRAHAEKILKHQKLKEEEKRKRFDRTLRNQRIRNQFPGDLRQKE